jgi:hypothetical protein
MNKIAFIVLLVLAVSLSALAQNAKPWPQWDKKDVEKMLNSSPWGQTQIDTDTSEMTATLGVSRDADGARNQAVDVKYRIRFFSAKPIREAFARNVLLANPNLQPKQLQSFVDGAYDDSIVVAVAFESSDRRYAGPISQAFGSATSGTLKNASYLERKDGKRIFLVEYAMPTNDGTGAKFVFPRVVDGKPFVSDGEDMIRFVADFGKGIKISWRFKTADMMYNGKLEY